MTAKVWPHFWRIWPDSRPSGYTNFFKLLDIIVAPVHSLLTPSYYRQVMARRKAKHPKNSASAAERMNDEASGKRDVLADMPVDIMHEIILYLHPRELLSLSRTSKTTHSFLMKKSSASYWKESLKKVDGLPACPDKLIEPAWVALVFSTFCTACGKGTALRVHWAFLMRLCSSCKPQLVVNDIDDLVGERLCLPDTLISRGCVSRTSGHCYLKSEVQQVASTWEDLSAPQKYDQLSKWITEQVRSVDEVHKFQDSCIIWLEKQDSARHREQDLLKQKRLSDITQRLQALGWGPELDMLKKDRSELLSSHRLVCMTNKLTEHGWRKVQGEIINFMQGIRTERLERQLCETLKTRWPIFKAAGRVLLDEYLNKYPQARTWGLNLADLAFTAAFREVMCVSTDVQVEKHSFMKLREDIDAIVEGWRVRICSELCQFIGRQTGQPPKDMDWLRLATTMFRCKRCSGQQLLFYPYLVAHRCLRHVSSISAARGSYYGSVCAYIGVPCIPEVNALEVFTSSVVRRVVRFCGKNPKTATAREMDALNGTWLVRGNMIMTWRAAIIDALRLKDDLSTWRMAELEESVRAKQRETWLIQAKAQLWRCTRCSKSVAFDCLEHMRSHCQRRHGVIDPKIEDGDIEMGHNPDTDCASGICRLKLKMLDRGFLI
ncbi:uncharacterized protein C8Q71DRAFT_840660 [Rhodofomes roseus]|uniref:F-box domain-containing protein n=1 Tax=Rhodofomes roseus TaxID=34475 RepID=A0ABQ8K5J8_9APHY|nr:uncharacterized protein C8Q71DRAFT_840660 [Rhodofomes roseus]KAH9832268.1 hypothetical protein C8Q71DRAFT_840660 [Rhodofomes roseus]